MNGYPNPASSDRVEAGSTWITQGAERQLQEFSAQLKPGQWVSVDGVEEDFSWVIVCECFTWMLQVLDDHRL